jgi:hypothetical protein
VTETNTQVFSRIKAEEKAASDFTQIQQQVYRQNRSLKREMSKQASDTAEAESLREALLTIAAMMEDLAKFQVMEKEYYSNTKIHADAKLHADELRQLEIIAANHRLKQTELEIFKYTHDNPIGEKDGMTELHADGSRQLEIIMANLKVKQMELKFLKLRLCTSLIR